MHIVFYEAQSILKYCQCYMQYIFLIEVMSRLILKKYNPLISYFASPKKGMPSLLSNFSPLRMIISPLTIKPSYSDEKLNYQINDPSISIFYQWNTEPALAASQKGLRNPAEGSGIIAYLSRFFPPPEPSFGLVTDFSTYSPFQSSCEFPNPTPALKSTSLDNLKRNIYPGISP